MDSIIYLIPWIIGLFGLIVGSFLNVVILRQGKSGIGGRSCCPGCTTTLHWYELVPVFSYLFQRGKCRSCDMKISWQYPVVEIVTTTLFFAAAKFIVVQNIPWASLPFLLIAISFAIIISVYDIRTRLVPMVWYLGWVIASLVYLIVTCVSTIWPVLVFHAAGAIVVLPFLGIWFISQGRWMGFADIEIIGWMGIFFGIVGGISATLLAFYLGAAFAIGFIIYNLLRGKPYQEIRKIQIPFAPFLLVSWMLTLLLNWNIFSLFLRIRV